MCGGWLVRKYRAGAGQGQRARTLHLAAQLRATRHRLDELRAMVAIRPMQLTSASSTGVDLDHQAGGASSAHSAMV
jgi:hypothetical protein